MNRIDEFADKFQGWLAEWAEKRQAAQSDSVLADQRPFLLTREGDNQALGSQAQISGDIGSLATENIRPYQGNSEPSADDGGLEEEWWSDSDTTREKWNSIKGR